MPLDPLEFRSPAIEFPRRDGSKLELFFASPWQRRLRTLWDYISGKSAAVELDFPNTLSGAASELTADIPGAALGDLVQVAPVDVGLIISNTFYVGAVSAAGVVTVTFVNHSAFAQNPPTGNFRIKVTQG